jgi:DeoR family glycerol-3-phosphate regulon repressor
MTEEQRHAEILTLAERDGAVSVEALSDQFSVTVQTIRRDLTKLAAVGQLERIHGGAVLPSGVSNIRYLDRRQLNRDAKLAIARNAAELIPNDASLFLNIGTTTEAVARALLRHQNLMVVTNNWNVATILSTNPTIRIIVTGGELRAADGALVGNIANDTIRQFKVDFGIIGSSALDQDGDIMDFDAQEVRVTQEIISRSRQTVLVCDSSKFLRTAPVRVGSLKDVDHFVTDRPLSERLWTQCQDWRTRIAIA